MTATLDRRVTLDGGVHVPQVGLGVFQVPSDEAQSVVEQALSVGYRHVDTAAAYVNEKGVGAAVRASGLPREEVFVTSKLRNGDQGYDQALRAYDDTCGRLGLDAVDLYLIHWPNPAAALWQDSWRALQRLQEEGRVRAIGVSNFLVEHLQEMQGFADRMPAVNQIELHPTFQQPELTAVCRDLGIAVEAYSPLGQGADLDNPDIAAIGHEVGASPAQVILRWHLEKGHVVIPKSSSADRMRANADLDGFTLTSAHVAVIDALESGRRIGGDPRTFSLSQIR